MSNKIRVHELRRRKRTYNENPTESREYTVVGSTSMDDIEAAMDNGTDVVYPSGWTGIGNATIGLAVLKGVDIAQEEGADNIWKVTATWGKSKQRDEPETNDEEITFDISPQTTKITQGLVNISNTAASGTAPNFHGAIGYNGKTFTGCDKIVGSLSFTITQYKPLAQITNAFVGNLENAVGCVNSELWRGRAAGECLFVGVSGSKRNEDDFQLAFKFQSQPNATSIAVGDITVPAKLGWEHLWVTYEDHEDTTASPKYMVKKPKSAHVEKIYNLIDFPTYLGIAAT